MVVLSQGMGLSQGLVLFVASVLLLFSLRTAAFDLHEGSPKAQSVFSNHHAPDSAVRPVSKLSSRPRVQIRGIDDARQWAEVTAQQEPSADDLFPAQTMDMPISHFPGDDVYRPHVEGNFSLRYWFDGSYYKPGGPVICLLGGETSGADRLPYMVSGILKQMAEATDGMAVILEHRYYGGSWPTPDLSTENLRFLTTDQALADADYFARNVMFPGVEDDLRAPNAPWIVYGGSYAGGMAAFLRTQYPDTFWGGISSSGVTVAITDFWEYNEPIRKYGPVECISRTQDFVQLMDYYLLDRPEYGHSAGTDEDRTAAIKSLFGLEGISDPADFASTVYIAGVGNWQSRNWDPLVGSPDFEYYCGNVTSPDRLYPDQPATLVQRAKRMAKAAGLGPHALVPLLNVLGHVNVTQVGPCAELGMTQDECFSTTNATFFAQDDLSQEWRSWSYQYCTQWGYFQTGASVPDNIRPLISRVTDVEFASFVCRAGFGIEELPDTDVINRRGGFGIEADRLGWVDGEQDPWRPAGPHCECQPDRESTVDRPWLLIEGGVHHWDENGRLPNETTGCLPPPSVAKAQHKLVAAVMKWHRDWLDSRTGDTQSARVVRGTEDGRAGS